MKFKKITKNQTESGRSMTEMLGVLAVMGVLSVGGIGGYTAAMRKHRANEIVSQLNLMGHECSRHYSLTDGPSPCDASELATEMDYATIDTDFVGVGDKMQTRVSGLSEDLTSVLKERLTDWGKTGIVSETDGLTLQMKKDLSDWGDATASTPCGENESCAEGTVCNQGACEACPDGKVPEGNQCVCPNGMDEIDGVCAYVCSEACEAPSKCLPNGEV